MAADLGTVRGQIRLDVRQAVASYAAVRAANARTLYALRGASASFAAFGRGAATAGIVISYGFYKAVKAAAEFERQLDFFGAVTNATEADMEKVRKKAIQLGQDTIYSAGQIADSFIELGKSGVSAQQIVDGVGDAVAHLGAAADIPLTTAANIITSAVQTFSLKAQDAVHVADLLAGAANASIAEVQDLGVSLKYVGGVAASISIPIEDVISALSILAKAGIRGSTAGTSLRQILISLTGTSKKATKELEALGIITDKGRNRFFTAKGEAKSLSQIFNILRKATRGLTQEQRLAAFKVIFNNRALAAANILTKAGAKGFKNMNKEIGKTTAADVSRKRLDNLSGDIEILRGNLETLFIQAGTPFQKWLRGIVQGITRLVQVFGNLPEKTQVNILKIVSLTGAALIAIGAFSLFVAAILRIAAGIIRFVAAIKFVLKLLKILRLGLGFIAFAFDVSLGIIFLVVAAIAILVVGFILLYKHSEKFRNFINAAGRDIVKAWKATIAWFKTLPAFFSNLWNTIKRDTLAVWNAIGNFFTVTVPGFFNKVVGSVRRFFTQTIPNLFKAGVAAAVHEFIQLPYQIGFLIGFMIGLVVRLLYNWIRLQFRIFNALVSGAISIVKRLPGFIVGFYKTMFHLAIAVIKALWHGSVRVATAIRQGVVNAIKALPHLIVAFFRTVWHGSVAAMQALLRAAPRIAASILRGVKNGLLALPGAIRQIFTRALNYLKGLAGRALKAGENFGKGLWHGFKKGVGIGSPSYIERAMWQITGVLDKESRRMPGLVAKVQASGNKLNKTRFTPEINAGFLTNTSSRALRQVAAAQKIDASLRRHTAASITPVRNLAAAGKRTAPGSVVNHHRGGDTVNITNINPMRERAEESVDKSLNKVAYRRGYRP